MKTIKVAEATELQLDWLVAHGCDQVQGYLLGRPMPLRDLLALLALVPDSA